MTWNNIITDFFESEEGKKLREKVKKKREEGKVYPEPKDTLRIFDESILKYEDIKIVIIGQDPYPNGEANGYAFASYQDKIPRSLQVVFKELHRDVYNYVSKDTFDKWFASPDLTKWHKQGIFSLNAVLTVDAGKPKSHWDMGWEKLIIKVIEKLNDHPEKLVFMLWGAKARDEYQKYIKEDRHLVLVGAHPAADFYGEKRFYGCGHFKKAIKFLTKNRDFNKQVNEIFEINKYVDFEKIKNEYINSIVRNRMAVPFDAEEKLNELLSYIKNDYHLYSPYIFDLTTS